MAPGPKSQSSQAGAWLSWARRFLLTTGTALLLGSAVLGASLPAQAQISSTEEYRLKFVYLYNIAKFVEWPANAFPGAQSPLNLCVVGRDPFDLELEQEVSGRGVNGHPFVTRRLQISDDVAGCHIIFLPAASDSSLPEILRRVGNSAAIIVGESAGFARRGGTLNFVIEGTRLRFEVNLDASQRTRSRISSRLLVLAKIVRPQQP